MQNILVPVAFAVLLALLLLPLVSLLERAKISPVLSIAISLLITFLFIAGLVYFFSTQIATFVDDIPLIKEHLQKHFVTLQVWIKKNLHVSLYEQNQYFNTAAAKLKSSGTGVLSDTFFSITEVLMLLILLPIYTFLLLYYRDLIKRFLFAVFPKTETVKVASVISDTKLMVKNYMLGLLIEMGIVAVANSFGLLILGIKYAVFFGVMSAVLNVIPYIGMFTATLFTVLITLSTSDSARDLLWVIIILYGVHMIDVNILMPKIVGSKVRINAMFSLIGVVIGGMLTGLSGLFLSVPAIALTKIIFDQVDDLKPWGMLLGDDITGTRKSKLYQKINAINLRKKKKLNLPTVE